MKYCRPIIYEHTLTLKREQKLREALRATRRQPLSERREVKETENIKNNERFHVDKAHREIHWY